MCENNSYENFNRKLVSCYKITSLLFYQRANLINKLIKAQQFCKQGLIHFIPTLGLVYKQTL